MNAKRYASSWKITASLGIFFQKTNRLDLRAVTGATGQNWTLGCLPISRVRYSETFGGLQQKKKLSATSTTTRRNQAPLCNRKTTSRNAWLSFLHTSRKMRP